MNYTQLVSAIKGYAENDFPATVGSFTSTDQLNTFIRQAEQKIYNTIQFAALRKNVVGTLTANNKYLSAPNDFLAVYSMAVIDPVTGAYEYLLNKDVSFIRETFPIPTITGKPTHYALFGPTTTNDIVPIITTELSFILGPTPNLAYSTELHYFYYPESITVAASGQTWLGDNFDSVLLYGSLCEAAAFMKAEGDVIQNYNTRFVEAMTLAKRLGDGMERGDTYRDGQARYPVK
jgi:hypothetical protein